MKVWIVNHYATTPDKSGGTRHYDLARSLLKLGNSPVIWAAGRNYNTRIDETAYPKGKSVLEKVHGGVVIFWVKTIGYRGTISRLFNMLNFSVKFYIEAARTKHHPDVVIGSTVHPFAALVTAIFCKRRNIPFVFEIRDLWPQTMIDLGLWGVRDPRSILFRIIERATYKWSDGVILLSPLTSDYLSQNYSTKSEGPKELLLPNFTDPSRFEGLDMEVDNEVLNKVRVLQKRGRKLIVFAGSIVQSNDLLDIVNMSPLFNEKGHDLVFIGGGQGRESVLVPGHSNVHLFDPIPKELVPVLLEISDVLLLTQGTVKWGSTNKAYDYLCSSTPIIASLSADHNVPYGEECGVYRLESKMKSDDFLQILDKISKLSDCDMEEKYVSRVNAIEANHSSDVSGKRLCAFLNDIANIN